MRIVTLSYDYCDIVIYDDFLHINPQLSPILAEYLTPQAIQTGARQDISDVRTQYKLFDRRYHIIGNIEGG